MSHTLVDAFLWMDIDERKYAGLSAQEKYNAISDWSRRARGANPDAFDSVTEWLLNDSEWSEETLAANEQTLMRGIIARFREQNAWLRAKLTELLPSGVVNEAAFDALDRFDEELSGKNRAEGLQTVVARVFADFSVILERNVREKIAGDKTGPSGTDIVERFGFINFLKEFDAGVQWSLFMPALVKRQQDGFAVDTFEYKKLPAMRFIGFEGEEYEDLGARLGKIQALDSINQYRTELDFDALLMHYNGQGVDADERHGIWGRFFTADTPVPEGYLSLDFLPASDGKIGAPYLSQFAFAKFSGDIEAMHRREGYDSDAMYDVTRNIILGQGVTIPYPNKYWTAEAFLGGFDKPSAAYLFSVEL